MPRARAAVQTSRTKPGKRLSAITASASATSAAGFAGPRGRRRSSRIVRDRALAARRRCRSPRSARARPRRAGRREQSMFSLRGERQERVADRVDAGRSAERPGEARARAEMRDRDGGIRRVAAIRRCGIRSPASSLPGRGNDATRNSMSSTAMPVHSTCLRAPQSKTPSPSSTQARMMWCAIAIGGGMLIPSGCSPVNISATSSRVNQRASSSSSRSTVISARRRLRVAADHQRHRERPGLRGEILHPPAGDAGFLQRLAPRRLLDALARLDEARKARPHVRRRNARRGRAGSVRRRSPA